MEIRLSSSEMPPERQRTKVGQYYLMEKIAQGGMAEIFKGLSYDVHGLKKTVCIKRILPQLSADKEFIEALVAEAKLAVGLVHGNIAQTFDLGKVAEDYFMVMEFVDGRSLSQIHRKCQNEGKLIPLSHLVYFISELLNGLDYMHRRTKDGRPLNIVHRDISPQNIMVSYSGTVKIIDFGIAKGATHTGPTDSGVLKGKFAYMSPEQAYGDAIDHRSDLFSAGIILHEMLTGKRLFKADDSRETIRNVRRCRVDAPSSHRPEIPDELDRIVMRSLSKDRRHRYAFASDMHADLVKYLYSAHPEFKPSDAAGFMQELFAEEIARPEPQEADARTPHLIIDRSNSALADDSQFEVTGATRAPMDMGEYMMEESTAPRPAQQEPFEYEGEDTPGPQSHIEEEEEKQKHAPPPGRRKRAGRKVSVGFFLAVLAAAAAAAYAAYHFKPKREPAASRAFAELMVMTDPADATVSMDGRFAGRGSPVSIRNISPDEEHMLLVEKSGYTPYERRIKLKPGQFSSASVSLAKSAAIKATLEIASTPPGATIFIDDRETSHRTPAAIAGMDAGREIVIGLYLDGHRFWSRGVEFKPGETKSFDVNLAKNLGSLFVDSSPQKALVMLDGM
ncbi:MAG TPA: serine/threonine-protein kinase, partial [bacterium]|nr:serine/threonine-protein kinase [bacterium]